MVEDDERLAGTPAAHTRLMQADWPHRLCPPVHGWGTFHLIVANRKAPSKAPVLPVMAITKFRISAPPGNLFTVRRDVLRQCGRTPAMTLRLRNEWERVMTNIVETLSDDELAQVAGGYGCAGNGPKGGYGDSYRLCNGVQQSSSSSSGLQHEPVHAS